MAYKYVNDNGLKAYTKKVKRALKDLHTPIAISTENTTESKAQNVKNIADFIAKAKAAGIADVNGMAVTCLIDNDYSGVGYLYDSGGDILIQGVLIKDDLVDNMCFNVFNLGDYNQQNLITSTSAEAVTSNMLTKGARNPIILTPETTVVDEETYQKLLSDDVDVIFKKESSIIPLIGRDSDNNLYFSLVEGGNTTNIADITFYFYQIEIKPTRAVRIVVENISGFNTVLQDSGYFTKDTLSPVLQEINLTGTDAERKAKLAQFEADWKNLTGASDLSGARFVGKVTDENTPPTKCVFTFDPNNNGYRGLSAGSKDDEKIRKIYVDCLDGTLTITALSSTLEPITIFAFDGTLYNNRNLTKLEAYKLDLEDLGVDTSKSFQVPFVVGRVRVGTLQYTGDSNKYIGVSYASDTGEVFHSEVDATGKYTETPLALYEDVEQVNTLVQAVKAFGAIELKASDNAANKAALTAYLKILTDAEVSTTNGYSVPVRITGNAQEYHGMLNIGTGALLSGIVTDVNENHHYPFNVSTADGAITFDTSNYFLEKTSNEVTEMLDAIKYSYTPVPLTATTLSNKAQLEVFLSKVPNAQVMHCTYKDVYAGTLHKINGDWFGLLVKNTNNYEDALQVKLQADGTLIEGTTSLAYVNSKLDTIIG